MKFSLLVVMMMLTLHVKAESKCDLRPGLSVGLSVVEFVSGHIIHSKIPMREASAEALKEEMLNLQDMGVCEEKITSQRCILKFGKNKSNNYISLIRGNERWKIWKLSGKNEAQEYVKSLKRAGFCS